MPGVYTNGVTPLLPVGIGNTGLNYSVVSGYETLPADTQVLAGLNPQSVAVTVFQAAAMAAGMSVNTVTEAANAATLNVIMGRIVSAAQVTAAGATYTVTLTNSTVLAASSVQAAVFSLTNTTPGLVIQSITPAAGSVVIIVRNNGTAALNGTIVIPFLVKPQ